MMALTPADQALVNDFLAKQALRRFDQGDSGDDLNLMAYLTRKGFKVYRRCGPRRAHDQFCIGRKYHSRAAFIAIINKERANDGLPPIGSLT